MVGALFFLTFGVVLVFILAELTAYFIFCLVAFGPKRFVTWKSVEVVRRIALLMWRIRVYAAVSAAVHLSFIWVFPESLWLRIIYTWGMLSVIWTCARMLPPDDPFGPRRRKRRLRKLLKAARDRLPSPSPLPEKG